MLRLDVRELTQNYYYKRPRWRDGTSQFVAMVRRRIKSPSRLLDLGAGRGKAGGINFRGVARTVVGLDPDWSVKENATVDFSVLGAAQNLPFQNAAFDLVMSDWVIEHLNDPACAVGEVFRVLEPGGYFVFRTGNLFHYSYTIAAITPHWFHRRIANWARALAKSDNDPHPTYYRMNTLNAVRRCLRQVGFVEEETLMVEAEPSYLMFSVPSFLAGVGYERLVNRSTRLSGLRACIFSCARKPF